MAQPIERRPRPRIESLSDLIFGLSLSIGSIALIANPPSNSGDILNHIAAFCYTFLILITSWLIYNRYMTVLPQETRWVTFLNIALLLLVALEPYLLNSVELVSPNLTSVADVSAIRDFSSSLYALDLAGIMLILAGFAHVIGQEEKNLVSPELARLFRNGRNRLIILSLVMFASLAPVFWQWTIAGVPVRLYVWYLPLISYWVGVALRPDSRLYRVSQQV